jgi:hypothetical protein
VASFDSGCPVCRKVNRRVYFCGSIQKENQAITLKKRAASCIFAILGILQGRFKIKRNKENQGALYIYQNAKKVAHPSPAPGTVDGMSGDLGENQGCVWLGQELQGRVPSLSTQPLDKQHAGCAYDAAQPMTSVDPALGILFCTEDLTGGASLSSYTVYIDAVCIDCGCAYLTMRCKA